MSNFPAFYEHNRDRPNDDHDHENDADDDDNDNDCDDENDGDDDDTDKKTHPRQDYYHATGNVNLYQVIHRSSLEVQFHFQA